MARSCVFVVAGPRACGKSTFIKRCQAQGSRGFLPDVLYGLGTAYGPIYLMDLANHQAPDDQDLLVHVDLVTPFADLSVFSESDLEGKLLKEAFQRYPGVSLFQECAELRILTLRVPRKVTMQRWLDRSAGRGRKAIRPVLAQLYSNAGGDGMYTKLYDAWDEYIAEFRHAKAWNVVDSPDANSYVVTQN